MRYVRPNKTCPANDFLNGMAPKIRKRFAGQFDAITKTGEGYINNQRFRPVTGADQTLWEFREDDHRLYCFKKSVPPNSVIIVLFSGWIERRSVKSGKEKRQIRVAQFIYREFINEHEGGSI